MKDSLMEKWCNLFSGVGCGLLGILKKLIFFISTQAEKTANANKIK
jgi:hypothetical protein